MTDEQVTELGAAIRLGFSDLAGRIAGGNDDVPTIGGHENVAIPLMEIAKALNRIAEALENAA